MLQTHHFFKYSLYITLIFESEIELRNNNNVILLRGNKIQYKY